MRVYTVHLRRHGLDEDRDMVLVKEGFSWPAFLFSFLWALWHRLWLAAAAIFAAQVVLGVAVVFLGPDPLSETALSLGLAAVVGYLGNDLRRRKLASLGFELADVVSGDNGETALRRFLDNEPRMAAELDR